MKTKPNSHPNNQGSILMISLCIATIVGIVLGGYLYLIRTQNVSVMRSQYWNAAMAVTEAGVEEALAQLNPGVLGPVNKWANNWTVGNGVYSPPNLPRNLANGSYYYVSFTDAEPPVITSTGYVTVPITGDKISRIVQVSTATYSPFMFGIVVKTNMDLNGNNVTIDSYNSKNGGTYDPNHPGHHGDVASKDGVIDAGNGNINGTLHIGPTVQVSVGPNVVIAGGTINDMNIDVPDVQPPFTWAGLPLLGSSFKSSSPYSHYDYVLTSGKYLLNSISGGKTGGQSLVVESGSTAVLYVPGNASLSGITIEYGATLKLYVGGPSLSIEGVTMQDAQGHSGAETPSALQVYGLSTLTDVTIGGNGTFTGVLYAPHAQLTMNGGGNDVNDWFGSVIVNSLTMNGHFNLHYDENLPASTDILGYRIASWKEL